MNRFKIKASVLFLIIGILAGMPQSVKADNTFNETESATIDLSVIVNYEVISSEGGYNVTPDGDTLIVSATGPVYVPHRETGESVLSCGQKILIRNNDTGDLHELAVYYERTNEEWILIEGYNGSSVVAPFTCKISGDGERIEGSNSFVYVKGNYKIIERLGGASNICSHVSIEVNSLYYPPGYPKEPNYCLTGYRCEDISSIGQFNGTPYEFESGVCGGPPWNCTGGGGTVFYLVKGPERQNLFERAETCQEPESVLPENLDFGPPSCAARVVNPVSVLNGNNYETATDITLSTPNRNGFAFSRYYNSQSDNDISLGSGWTHTYSTKLVFDFEFEGANYLQLIDATGQGHYFYSDGLSRYNGVFKERTHVEQSGDTYIWYRTVNSKYVFDSTGRLIRTEDELGNFQNLTYESGLLRKVTDEASGRVLKFIYDANNRLHVITGPSTQAVPNRLWVTYLYDADGNLETVTYPDGSGFRYVYDDPNDPHNMTEKSNLAGHLISTWDYDGNDRVTQNDNRDGKGGTIEYVSHNEVKVTDAYAKTRTYTITTIDGRKRVGLIEGGEGCQSCGSDAVRFEYDSKLNITEKEYANGRIDKFQNHTDKGRAQTVILAVGTEDERTVYQTYHPTLNTPLTRTETGLIQGDKITVWDYDDPDASGDTDVENEDPTLLIHRKIETGFTSDISGNPISYEYVTVYEYYPNGQLKSTDGPKDGDADKISYTYHSTGDLYQATQPLIGPTVYDNYDEAGNVGTVKDVNGIATVLTYDGRNRVLTTTRNGIINERTYDTAGNLETSSVGGIVTTYEYYDDSAEPFKFGRLHKIINASGDYVCHDYDSNGNRIEKSYYAINEDSTYTRKKYRGFEYYDATGTSPGKLWKEVNPDNTATVYEYDNMGNIGRVTDAENKATAYSYDLFNRTGTVTQAAHSSDPAVTAQDYDLHGNLKSVTDAESNETVYHYDDLGRRVKRESPDTGVTVYEYDSAGNTVATKDANAVTVDYVYDSLNRLTNINYPDATQNIVFTYDLGAYAKGKLSGVTFPLGSVKFAYNADGRVSGVTEIADGQTHTVSYEYHATGQTEKITFNSGMVVEYVIDPDGNVSEVKVNGATLIGNLKNLPFGPTESMSMENDKLSFVRDFTLRYQPENILAKWGVPTPQPTPTPEPTPTEPPFPTPTESPFPTPTLTLTESPFSTPGTEPTATESMSLSESASLTPSTTTAIMPFPTPGDYELNPNVISDLPQEYPHAWPSQGPLTTTNQIEPFAVPLGPDPFGPDPFMVMPGVMETERQPTVSFSSDYEPVATLLKTGGNETVLMNFDYTYHANGNVKTIDGPAIPSMSGQASTYTLVPDKGNRLDNVTNGGQAVTYDYDNNGNITSDESRTFVYNQHNRLVKVKQGETVIAEYSYNAFGQRIKKVASGKTVYYHYDQKGNLLAESNGDGTPSRDYIYLNGERIAMMIYGDQAGMYYFLNDHLGTPHKIVNSEGVIVWEAAYLPFGKGQIITETIENNFRFPGQYYDAETGLCYNWHRYYDPNTGRYLTPDPIGLRGGINLFAYVINDPINGMDLWGLAKCTYSISKHTMICISNTVDNPSFIGPDEQRQVGPDGVFSGQGECRNKPSNECLEAELYGPVVPGNYKMNKDNRLGHENWWRLEPSPKIPGWKVRLGLVRGGFAFHLGSRSAGCINADENNPVTVADFNNLHRLLLNENGQNTLKVIP